MNYTGNEKFFKKYFSTLYVVFLNFFAQYVVSFASKDYEKILRLLYSLCGGEKARKKQLDKNKTFR